MGVPGRVYITTWLFGVSSCVFATARVATPLPSVTLVLDRRPDSAGNHVVDVNREKHDEKRLESQRKRMRAVTRGRLSEIAHGVSVNTLPVSGYQSPQMAFQPTQMAHTRAFHDRF